MNARLDHPRTEPVAQALAESEHLRIDPGRLEDLQGHSIMIGGFGTVRVARLDDQIVAVKELRIIGTPEDRIRFSMRFARELKVWSRLDHPNLLKLSGFYMDKDISVAQFICPFYSHGHIRKYIDANQPDFNTRLRLVSGVASKLILPFQPARQAADTAMGLQYLHENKIVHGDLKELNVLVHPAPCALLCDYGLAKMVNPGGTDSGLTTSSKPISLRFASPELMDGCLSNFASDVWAWGCLFIQIILDIDPYHGTTDIACIRLIAQGISPADVSTLNVSFKSRRMLNQCWNQDPLMRPDIAECVAIVDPLLRHHYWLPIWHTSSGVSMQVLECSGFSLAFSVAFSPDGALLASAFFQEAVHLYDVASCGHMARLDLSYGVACHAVTFSPDGRRLVCGLQNGYTSTWDVNFVNSPTTAGRCLSKGHSSEMRLRKSGQVLSVAFSPDGSLFAFGGEDGSAVHSVRDGRPWELLFHLDTREYTWNVAFSPTGRWLASCGKSEVVRIWDITIPTEGSILPVAKLEGHTKWVRSTAFSPDGRWLATGSSDKRVIIWKVPSWESVIALDSEDFVTSVTFSPDSRRLASATFNGTIELWDTMSWRSIKTLKGHGRGYISITFSSNGRIASASNDKTVRIWQVKPDKVSHQDSRT